MHPSIARYLNRQRDRLAGAVARPLERALGAERARVAGQALVTGLEQSLLETDPGAFLGFLRESAGRWTGEGVDADGVGEALLALIRSPGSEVRGLHAKDWLRELKPMVDFIPTPLLFIEPGLRIVIANRAFCELSGEIPETLAGRPLAELIELDAHGGLHVSAVGDGPATGMPQLERVRLRSQPGRGLLVSRVPFAPGGPCAGWFVTLSPDALPVIAEASLGELLEREKRQKEKFAALLTISNAVVNTLDLNTILSMIARQVRQVIQTDECTVFLFDERDQMLFPVVCDARSYVEEMMACRLRLGEGITGIVAQTGRGEIVNDAEADPRAVTVPGTPPEQTALLCVPLMTREVVVGVITLSRIGERGFHDEDLELATLFAGQCSAAIANARLYEDMKAAFDQLRETQTQLVQSAKLNALGEMAGGVAHDFNNILAAILGRTQLLLQSQPDVEIRRQLQVIEQAALDGAHTVRRVQEFTRVRHDERFETLDVNQVLLGVIELTRPAWESGAKRHGIAVDVHLELRATGTTAGNASELREVFTNLVLNAVDAMPGGGELWVSSENGAGVVRVQVRDTGVGMSAGTREKIFDPFFTTKEAKGTGLGLSVAYGIVSRHRGTIDVESETGIGTVFTLTFPIGCVERAVVVTDSTFPPPRMRVLVVDDEEAVLEVLVDLLAAMGMDVEAAHGGPAGIDAVNRGTYDVVFSDLGMPEVNGYDLAMAIKSRRPQTAVVLVTGWGYQIEQESATARGVDLVMPKPFSWEDVERALRLVADPAARKRAA